MIHLIISLLLMSNATNLKLEEIGTIEGVRADKICIINKNKIITSTYQNISIHSKFKKVKNYDLKGYVPDQILWNNSTIYSSNFVINTKNDLVNKVEFQNVELKFENSDLHDVTLYDFEIKQTAWIKDFTKIIVLLNYRPPRNKKVEEDIIPKSILMKLDLDKNEKLKLIWHKEYNSKIPKFSYINEALFLINGSIEKISESGLSTNIGSREWNIRQLVSSDNNTITAFSNKERYYEINIETLEISEYDEQFPDILLIDKFKNKFHLATDNKNQLFITDSSKIEFNELFKSNDKILSISSNSKYVAIGFLAPIPYINLYCLESN